MKNKLQWQQEIDGDELKIHIADSKICDEEGVPFLYRIVKRRAWKLWREDSDSELTTKKPRKWRSLSDAKRAMQMDENESLAAF